MTETVYGTLSLPPHIEDLVIFALREYGEWAFTEHNLFAQLIREGSRVWDAGAFIGTFGLGAVQSAQRKIRVAHSLLSIEPSLALRPYIQNNLFNNCPCSWDIASVAVALQEGSLFSDEQDETNHGAQSYSQMATHQSSVKVPALPLWKLRIKYGDYDCIKLDLEGMEADALRSDFEYLEAVQPNIWIECNEDLKSIEILDLLVAAGYDPMYIAFPAFRTDNYSSNPNILYPLAYEAALVAGKPDHLQRLIQALDAPHIISAPVKTAWDLRQILWRTPRWGETAWAQYSYAELIALMGRFTLDQSLDTFLLPEDLS